MKKRLGSICSYALITSFGLCLGLELYASNAESKKLLIMSYNVENLFDQKDDPQNQGYGDYRLKPNNKGQYSNYGKSVDCPDNNSLKCNFTEVKIANLQKILLALEEKSPDIIGLQEVESPDVLELILSKIKNAGYHYASFSSEDEESYREAVGTAVISRFPIIEKKIIRVARDEAQGDHQRPILRVGVQAPYGMIYVYNNHWRAKSAPESKRMLSAEYLLRDIIELRSKNLHVDYIILGDLNSNYNENETLEDQHNDTNGRTGINDVLDTIEQIQTLKKDIKSGAHYNLHLEVAPKYRKTAYHEKYGWSSFDHMIVGATAFDQRGYDYVEKSFATAATLGSALKFLFDASGNTKSWMYKRLNQKYTEHKVGGYSDHMPIFSTWQAK